MRKTMVLASALVLGLSGAAFAQTGAAAAGAGSTGGPHRGSDTVGGVGSMGPGGGVGAGTSGLGATGGTTTGISIIPPGTGTDSRRSMRRGTTPSMGSGSNSAALGTGSTDTGRNAR